MRPSAAWATAVPLRLRGAARGGLALLLALVDAVAALLLAADLIVVLLSVFYRYVLDAPIEWADDVARGLMVALSFFGAAGALARNENVGVAFFVQRLPPRLRRRVDAVGGAGGARDRGLGGLERDRARPLYHRADHRLRPAAGIDLLSDGGRRALHDRFRARAILPPAAV